MPVPPRVIHKIILPNSTKVNADPPKTRVIHPYSRKIYSLFPNFAVLENAFPETSSCYGKQHLPKQVLLDIQ
jgi:hypothetical protein